MSGVVLEDDGVALFLGIIVGLAGADRSDSTAVGIAGGGGVFTIVDNRFSLLASVGLTVLAPNPDACGI